MKIVEFFDECIGQLISDIDCDCLDSDEISEFVMNDLKDLILTRKVMMLDECDDLVLSEDEKTKIKNIIEINDDEELKNEFLNVIK